MSVAHFYAAPSNQSGGFIVYQGARRQRGAGSFGSFRRFMAPVGRQALQGIKTVGRQAVQGIKTVARNKTVQNIAKQAAAKGAEIATGVAVDALQGRNIGEALKERSRDVALRTLTGQPAPMTESLPSTSSLPVPPPPSSSTVANRKRKRSKKRSLSRMDQRKARISLMQRKRSHSSNGTSAAAAPLVKRRRVRRKLSSRAEKYRRELF